jgi:CelD/BcsL family acetyltransferase involved in cellulose biosynthesis
VEEITTTAGLWQLRSNWNEIEAAGEPVNPFLSWDWQWSWWENFGTDLELHCFLVWDGDYPLGIVPLYSAPGPSRIMRFGGGVALSDHLGFLFRPGRAEEVAAAVLDRLFFADGRSVATPGTVSLDLHFVPDASPALAALRAAAEPLELRQSLTQEEVSPRVVLDSDFQSYLSGRLNKKDRHELRRKLRRLDNERPGWRLVDQDLLGLERALDAFFPILKASGPHKVEFLTTPVEAFIRSASGRIHKRGWLRIQFIESDGRFLAASLGFTVSGRWHLYNSGYEPELAALSPGLICVAEGIRAAIAEGCHTADFLRGSEGYKYHLGAENSPLWRLELSPTGGPETRT